MKTPQTTSEDQPLTVRVRRLRPGARVPRRQTEGAAGSDLVACLDAPVRLEPGDRALIPTGIAIALPDGFEAQVRPRSGLALEHGVTILNAPGTIDSDYRGEVNVLLVNLGREPYVVQHGDRVAQLVVAPVSGATMTWATYLPETGRGEGGFGHTGR